MGLRGLVLMPKANTYHLLILSAQLTPPGGQAHYRAPLSWQTGERWILQKI